MADRRRWRRRLPAEGGRRALLGAGRALVPEQPRVGCQAHRSPKVAERAGVSVGAAPPALPGGQDATATTSSTTSSRPSATPSLLPTSSAGRDDGDADGDPPSTELVRAAPPQFAACGTRRAAPAHGHVGRTPRGSTPASRAQYPRRRRRWATFTRTPSGLRPRAAAAIHAAPLMATLITAGRGLAVRATVTPTPSPTELGADPDRPVGACSRRDLRACRG